MILLETWESLGKINIEIKNKVRKRKAASPLSLEYTKKIKQVTQYLFTV